METSQIREPVFYQRPRQEQYNEVTVRFVADQFTGKVEHGQLTRSSFKLASCRFSSPTARPIGFRTK